MIPVDRMEQMLGSYGPQAEPYIKNFETDRSPSGKWIMHHQPLSDSGTGMLARSGTYNVRSRVVDDDGEVYAGTPHFFVLFVDIHTLRNSDWEWSFKLAKEWEKD